MTSNKLYYAMAVVMFIVGIVDAWFDAWLYAVSIGMLGVVWLTFPSIRRVTFNFGYSMGRNQVISTVREAVDRGLTHDQWREGEMLRELVDLGVMHECKECLAIVPRAQSVHNMHEIICSLHPSNVADAQ